MNKTKKQVLIGSLTVCMVLAAFSLYRNSTEAEFTPFSAREFQQNRVEVNGDKKPDGKNETDNGRLWEKDSNSSDQEGASKENNGDYLYDNAETTATIANAGSGTSTASDGTEGADTVYDVVSGNGNGTSNSDITISDGTTVPSDTPDFSRPGQNTDNNGNGNGNGTGTDTVDYPNYVRGDTVKDPVFRDEDKGSGSENAQKFYDGIVPDIGNKDDPDTQGVVIEQNDESSPNQLYEGKTVTAKDIYFTLNTYVMKWGDWGMPEPYEWQGKDYGTYITVDAYSFDGGNTWSNVFPVTIPTGLSEGQMKLKVSWRLSRTDSWKHRIIDYTPRKTRLFVLDKTISGADGEIEKDSIINTFAQYPDADSDYALFLFSNVHMEDLFSNNGWLNESEEQTVLFPGWVEDGKKVNWIYHVTSGRHVLQPAPTVKVPEGFHLKLQPYFLDDSYQVAEDGMKLAYFQTLTGFSNGAEDLAVTKDGVQSVVRVPEYTQAIDLDPFLGNCYDQMEIPESVLYIHTDSVGLCVYDRYIVDQNNTQYSSSEEGLLMNKNKTEIIAIPLKMTDFSVPSSVRKVNLTEYNSIQSLTLQSADIDTLPDIDYSRLQDAIIYVQSAILEDFVQQNKDVIESNHLKVASIADKETRYIVKSNLMISNTGSLHASLNPAASSVTLPSEVKHIDSKAFEGTWTTTLVLPSDGHTVSVEQDAFGEWSQISTMVCSTEEQRDAMKKELERAGLTGIELVLTGTTKEGYTYYSSSTLGKTDYVLMHVPQASCPEEFDGTITLEDGSKVVVSEIGDEAFKGCSNLKRVNLKEQVTRFGTESFEGCENLESFFIQNTEHIQIGNRSLDNCPRLRFVASNAKWGEMESNYNPLITDTNGPLSDPNIYFYVPYNAEEYCSHSLYFPEGNNVYSYKVIDDVLYGCDEEGTPWLAIRAGEVEGEMDLPSTIIEFYSYAFADIDTAYTIPFERISGHFYIDAFAFYNSGLSDLKVSSSVTVASHAFEGCTQLTNIQMDGPVTTLNEGAFNTCSSLKSVTFGYLSEGSLIYNLFYNCPELTDIYLNGDYSDYDYGAPSLLMSSQGNTFQFNAAWSDEEEAEKLNIHLGENILVSDLIKSWRLFYLGYANMLDYSGFTNLWNDCFKEILDKVAPEKPDTEEVDALVRTRMVYSENKIRKMLNIPTVEEPTPYVIYDIDESGNITVRSTSGEMINNVVDLSAEQIGLPSGWCIDYVDADAFRNSAHLKSILLPPTPVTLRENFLRGIESEQVTLIIWSTIPTLQVAEEGTPYAFGIEDSRLQVINFNNQSKEDIFNEWKYALIGYNDAFSFVNAMMDKVKTDYPDLEEFSDEYMEKLQEMEDAALQEASDRFDSIYVDIDVRK